WTRGTGPGGDSRRQAVSRHLPGISTPVQRKRRVRDAPGLGVIPGRVVRFASGGSPTPMKVPHMGWNSIAIGKRSPVLDGVPDGAFMYFVHSYYVVPDDQSVACTMTDYGRPFVSSVARDNIFACQ